jgi:hypothetical protein
MAIDALYLQYLKHAIDQRRGATTERLRGLLLAYPDLLVPRAGLVRILGEAALAGAPERNDAAQTWEYHGLRGVTEPLYDSLAVLERMGVDSVVIDAAKLRGMERVVDLNHPLPEDLARSFDVVVDTGTCEHCFNVAQAFANSCEALAIGGVLVHAAPLTRINHGFWNFNPTVYPDFFEANGFDLLAMAGVTGDLVRGMQPFEVELFGRSDVPPGAALYVIAKRREIRPLKWPVQRKYRHMLA